MVKLRCSETNIYIDIHKQGNWIPAYKELRITLPNNETRQLVINGNVFTKGELFSLNNIPKES